MLKTQDYKVIAPDRIELLVFRLYGSDKLYGMNIFTVKEVSRYALLNVTTLPTLHNHGVAKIRGEMLPIIDLNQLIGGCRKDDLSNSLVIISEYNKLKRAFIIESIDQVLNLNWKYLKSPITGISQDIPAYLAATAHIASSGAINIIDTERLIYR